MSHEAWLTCRVYLNQLDPNSPHTTDLYTILNSTPQINKLSKNKKLRINELILKLIDKLSTKSYLKFLSVIKFLNFLFNNLKFNKETIEKIELIGILFKLVDKINNLPNTLNLKELICIESVLEIFYNLINGHNKTNKSLGLILNFMEFNLILNQFNNLHYKLNTFHLLIKSRLNSLEFVINGIDSNYPLISQLNRDHELFLTEVDHPFDYQDKDEMVHRAHLNDQLQHLINQGAPINEIKDLLTGNHYTLQDFTLLPFIVQKMRCILKRTQKEFNFLPEINHDPNLDKVGDISISMKTPQSMNFLYGALELADQLYWLVTIENITLHQLVRSISQQVFTPEDSFVSPLEKDNLILWWIVQLFYIDYIANNVMPQDLQGDQEIFTQMVALYNANQVLSKDGCYLRDLALQCAMALQSANIPDRSGLKRKHPTLITAIPYSQMCTAIQSYFNTNFKLKSTDSNIFNNLSHQDLHRISITSLSRKSMVPITMYVSLVPNHHFDFLGAGYLEARFLKGSSISSDAIDFTNIGAKQELLSLIYSMMLDLKKGPCLPQGRSKDITCVAPNVLDAVFKLVYNAPHSVELILETMLQSLNECDQTLNTSTYSPQLVPLTWRHTVLQLLTHRLLRYLKNIKFPSLIPTYIKHQLNKETHYHLYSEIESFAIGALNVHSQLQHLEHFLPLHQSTPIIWFETNSMLARISVMKLARTINTIGLSKASFTLVPTFLSNLHKYQLHFSDRTLRFFPPIMQTFFSDQQHINKQNAPTIIDIVNYVNQNITTIQTNFNQPSANSLTSLLSIFGNSSTMEFFLPALWKSTWQNQTFKKDQWDLIRPILISFGPKYKYDNTCSLIWYVLYNHKDDEDATLAYKRISQWIFDYQLISLDHAIFTLACHHSIITDNDSNLQKTRWDLTRYLLFSNEELLNRYKYWSSLNINSRIWKEDDFNTKYQSYLDRYPEFFEFEKYSYDGQLPSKTPSPSLNPSIQIRLPMYYNNALIRFSQLLEPIFSGWIENAQVALLVRFLSTFPDLIKLHPLRFDLVLDTISYFNNCEWFHSSAIKQLIQALDPLDYPFTSIFKEYIWGKNQADNNSYNSDYFQNCLTRVVDSFDPGNNFLEDNEGSLLPPKQYREIPNPTLLSIKLSQLEILGCPLPTDQKIQKLIELITIKSTKKLMKIINIKSLGLIISGLPFQDYLIPILNHCANLLQLGEICKMGPNLTTNFAKETDYALKFAINKLKADDKEFSWPFKFTAGERVVADEFIQSTLLTPHQINLNNFNSNNLTNYSTLLQTILNNSNYLIVNNFIAALNSIHQLIFTDRQLIFVCSLLGPLLKRLKSDSIVLEMYLICLANCIDNFLSVNSQLKALTPNLDLIIGFLNYLKYYIIKEGFDINIVDGGGEVPFIKFKALIQQLQLKWSLNGIDNLLADCLVNLI